MKCWRRKKEKDKARKCFLENGSMFLEQLIADCNGISNPIRMFSSDQISKATNQFDPMCSLPHISPYFTCGWRRRESLQRYCLFLKLIGSCLEFPLPVLVYEDLEYRALNIRGSVGSEDGPLLPWNVHLKIAKEVATAITYLHTAFPRIILHRDIKAANVFLDKNWKASLTDFSSAVTLPEGYVDSYYLATGIVTEYSDVFSFGILMLVLLLGRPQLLPDGHSDFRTSVLDYVKDLRERGEPVEFGGDMRPGQMNMLLDLALRYCEERNEDRPKMISVAKEIKLIEQASL
uniref:Protein kinase domain-containing protein n=1 Tax=Brassica campestris TaxID=3711 RepID=M4DDN8_BRACM